MVSDSQYQFCFLHIALVLKAHREKRTQHLMSIVSSSHTPQGRGEEKGANYKWPHPVLPDFSSSGIGPRFISAQAALRQDPPRLLGAPRCHEVRGEAARSRPPAGRGGRGRQPCSRGRGCSRELPASRPPSPEATEPGLPRYRQQPRTAHTSAAAPCPGAEPGGAAPAVGRGTGRNRSRLHKRQTCRRTGGNTLPLQRGFQSAFSPSPPSHEDTRTSLIDPLQLRSPLPADCYTREGE